MSAVFDLNGPRPLCPQSLPCECPQSLRRFVPIMSFLHCEGSRPRPLDEGSRSAFDLKFLRTIRKLA